MNVFNSIILARNRQLPDDDRMIETCRSFFKSFNVNNLGVCIGWCADQVTLRSARCNGKHNIYQLAAQKVKILAICFSYSEPSSGQKRNIVLVHSVIVQSLGSHIVYILYII